MAVVIPLLLELAKRRPSQSVELDDKLFAFFVSYEVNICRTKKMCTIIIIMTDTHLREFYFLTSFFPNAYLVSNGVEDITRSKCLQGQVVITQECQSVPKG